MLRVSIKRRSQRPVSLNVDEMVIMALMGNDVVHTPLLREAVGMAGHRFTKDYFAHMITRMISRGYLERIEYQGEGKNNGRWIKCTRQGLDVMTQTSNELTVIIDQFYRKGIEIPDIQGDPKKRPPECNASMQRVYNWPQLRELNPEYRKNLGSNKGRSERNRLGKIGDSCQNL